MMDEIFKLKQRIKQLYLLKVFDPIDGRTIKMLYNKLRDQIVYVDTSDTATERWYNLYFTMCVVTQYRVFHNQVTQ